MKTVSLFAVLAITVCLVGCENAELVTCQQEKDLLQGQVDQANAAITEKDAHIDELETEVTEKENLAMQSIQTIMQKQAERDNQIKQKLVERAKQIQTLKEKVASLEAQITAHVCVTAETLDGDEDGNEDEDEDEIEEM